MKIRGKLILVIALVIVALPGCVSLTPKRDVMKIAIAKTSTRKTSKPWVFAIPGQVLAVGQEETVETNVEYGKSTPVQAKRSIFTRWWFWVLVLGVITYFGLWPFIIRAIKKLKAKLKEALESAKKKSHALTTVVKQIDVFKAKAETDPKANDVSELRTVLSGQDPVTKAEVKAVRDNG